MNYQAFCSLCSMPAALRTPKKHSPGCSGHVISGKSLISACFCLWTLCSMPATLRNPQQKHSPGFPEHVMSEKSLISVLFSLCTLCRMPVALRNPQKSQSWIFRACHIREIHDYSDMTRFENPGLSFLGGSKRRRHVAQGAKTKQY